MAAQPPWTARVLDLKAKSPVAFYSKSSGSEEELIKALSDASNAVYEKMLSVLKGRITVKSGAIDRIAVTGNRRVDTEAIMKDVLKGRRALFGR